LRYLPSFSGELILLSLHGAKIRHESTADPGPCPACCIAAPAQAAYPEKPVRFVVPSAPGGSVDVLMRILTQQLSAQMGVAFVVENKPGASFVPGDDGHREGGAGRVHAGPYGNIVSLAVNRTLLPALPYDVEKDLTLVSNCVRVFNMLAVNNGLPVRTVAELIDYAKKNPGKLSNGSSGTARRGTWAASSSRR